MPSNVLTLLMVDEAVVNTLYLDQRFTLDTNPVSNKETKVALLF